MYLAIPTVEGKVGGGAESVQVEVVDPPGQGGQGACQGGAAGQGGEGALTLLTLHGGEPGRGRGVTLSWESQIMVKGVPTRIG